MERYNTGLLGLTERKQQREGAQRIHAYGLNEDANENEIFYELQEEQHENVILVEDINRRVEENDTELQVKRKQSNNKSGAVLQDTDELKCEGSGDSQNFTDGNIKFETPEQATKTRSSSIVESIQGAIEKLAKISDGNKTRKQIHEFDAFCNNLAIQLKKRSLRQALICQEKLQAVMTQQRLSVLPSDNRALPLDVYTSTPSPASIFFWAYFTRLLFCDFFGLYS
ncbi:hypothetical protein ILUMI_17996 [Ignelater luminosus]|uniref:Uncharacterized protein n=1 Tax=Ignelater luminosus TaxID=2038154 RepID=A0A8K0G4J8_IGNLU|nr:hypothetical protein ILUMI_17996 [Ignelater luminosus]